MTKSDTRQDVAQLDGEHVRPAKNRALKRFLKHRVALFAVFVLMIIAISALFAPAFAPYEYDKIDLRARGVPPSVEHWFGTDRVGRDIWSRTLHGGQVSLAVGIGATLISTSIGTVLGAIAGYYRGWVDNIIMRITDTVMTFPSIVIMLTLAALLPRSLLNIVLIIGGLSWPAVARLVRAQFMSMRETEFVMAARALGVRDVGIIVRHILPNVFAPLVALITFSVGSAILTEAGLSFLGLGVPPPTPSWGNMLESARNLDILKNLPWMWVPPAIMTVLTVLCVNFIGDGIRDAIDPRLVL
ncbi:MAG: peptide ABC transporter permease [Anaerolineaceae bacterium]|nr:peptide ABC transporter permease [Anaerolineaceae bacterium]